MDFVTRNTYVLWVVYCLSALAGFVYVSISDAPMIFTLIISVLFALFLSVITMIIFTLILATCRFVLLQMEISTDKIGANCIAVVSFIATTATLVSLAYGTQYLLGNDYQVITVQVWFAKLVIIGGSVSLVTTIHYLLSKRH